MKRRHIESLGYRMISIPYWAFTKDMSDDKKRSVLKAYLSRIKDVTH
jgi:Na+/melibiose symporter-like transporter